MNVKQKTIWITGASSGIGRALAVNLSRRGVRLILSGRSAERLEDCRQACTDPERHAVLPLDLTNLASIEEAARHALQKYGPIDISVNALKGDGSTLGSMDAAQAAGMDPEICAEKIVRAVEAKRNEVYIGGKEKLGVYLQRFVPDLFALIIRKFLSPSSP